MATASSDWSVVADALAANRQPQVRALSVNDRLALQAVLALKQHRVAHALELLDAGKDDGDPLLNVITAEAHRRQAVKALQKAGVYAHPVQRQSQLLADAHLQSGFGEAEAKLDLLRDHLQPVQGVPTDLLALSSDVANVFMVDKLHSRLLVYARDAADGRLKKLADEYVVTGARMGDKQQEGDERTPNGVYRFIRRLSGDDLTARYGPVAFPIDYPNVLDRLHHKNGHGIWLHGFARSVERRPPRDTNGCFSLPNDRLQLLAPKVRLGKSWVVVGNNLHFGDGSRREGLRRSVQASMNRWVKDWQSLNTDRYLGHYHRNFRSGKRDLKAWKRYKHRVNRGKRMIQVRLSDLTLIHDPNRWPEGEVVVAQFVQHYRSSNYRDRSIKRLYLARKSVRRPWKILSEETITPLK
ncbi:MAG: L,D-transpeptidase family protein [Mariprofundales bacterium]